MNGSIYDKNTGAFMWYGNSNSTKYDKLVQQGHIWVEGANGGPPNWLKYDFVTGTTVTDTGRVQGDQDKKAAQAAGRARADAIRAQLATLYQDHTGTNTQQQVDLLNEYVRLHTPHQQ